VAYFAAADLPALRKAVAIEPVVIAFATQFKAPRPVAEEDAIQVFRQIAQHHGVAGHVAAMVGVHRQLGILLQRGVEVTVGQRVGQRGAGCQAERGKAEELAAVVIMVSDQRRLTVEVAPYAGT
jgi:hypothetical protein